MEEALLDVPLCREFAGLDNWTMRLPDESTILRFRQLLEKHKLAAQILALVNDILRDKGLMLRRHGGGRDADQRAEFDQERFGRTRPRRCIRARKGTNGISA